MRVLVDIYKALSEETRLRIMGMLLLQGELCVCDVEGALGISQSKSSRHLRILLNAGLVTNRREGTWMHYLIPTDLAEPHKGIVLSLHNALGQKKVADLEQRLSVWFEKKAKNNTICKASL